MARMRRRSGGPVADWVYRGNRFLQSDYSAGEANPSGTYGSVFTLNSGAANVTAQVLYDSDATMRTYGVIDPATATWMDIDAAARPQGSDRGALIHGVDVHFNYRPATWAIGSILMVGWRIIIATQDPDSGQAQIDTAYSMFTNVTGDAAGTITRFANGRQNCAEGRRIDAFSDNGQYFTVRRYCKFKRRLQADEGLFLFLEGSTQSVNIGQLNTYCRTLVTDAS